MKYNPVQDQNSYHQTKNECCEKCLDRDLIDRPICSNSGCLCHHPAKEEKKITDHVFDHGCMKDCPYDHSQNFCVRMIETVDSYRHCNHLQKDHEK